MAPNTQNTRKYLLKLIILSILTTLSKTGNGRTFCALKCETCLHYLDKCLSCGEGTYWHYDYHICVEGALRGCKIYSAYEKCAECYEGFANQSGKCTRCSIPRCADCSESLDSCIRCKTGFTFVSLTASPKRCDTACLVPNCKKCFIGQSNFCQECLEGYRRTPSDSCEPCVEKGCKLCPVNANVCAGQCLEGYFWSDSNCKVCPNGCKKCNSFGRCEVCDTNKNYFMNINLDCVLPKKANLLPIFWLLILIKLK